MDGSNTQPFQQDIQDIIHENEELEKKWQKA